MHNKGENILPLDWDKLRIFHATAKAGSFTHAGNRLGLSQSAVSRQISNLELDLKVMLFHRHARGLLLTEQGEALFSAANDVAAKLDLVQEELKENKEKPQGLLRLTTTIGLGSRWLSPRLDEFIDAYPDITLEMALTEDELDLGMREADVAIRLHRPTQPDLIQKRLFEVHLHAFCSKSYIEKNSLPRSVQDLSGHQFVGFSDNAPTYLRDLKWLETLALKAGFDFVPRVKVNNLLSLRLLVKQGVGIAVLPDYLVSDDKDIIQVDLGEEPPSFETYVCYPEELRNSAKIMALRDFLTMRARAWKY